MDEAAENVTGGACCIRRFRISALKPQVARTKSAPRDGERRRMSNSKLQAAIDELERLYATVKAFKARNGMLPNPDSDAGRAVLILESFADELKKLQIGQLVYVSM
jgi:hypothetical protein